MEGYAVSFSIPARLHGDLALVRAEQTIEKAAEKNQGTVTNGPKLRLQTISSKLEALW